MAQNISRSCEQSINYSYSTATILLAEKEYERLKKKTIRRNAPQGEDIQGIRSVLRGMKGQEISVHEFVGIISPFTGDNGTVFINICGAVALNVFRNDSEDCVGLGTSRL